MKKLLRSRKNSMITGVCGGLADYLGIDATVVRVVYVCLSILTAAFPGILLYIVLTLIIPSEY